MTTTQQMEIQASHLVKCERDNTLAAYDNRKQEYLKGVPINHLSRLHDNTKAYLFQFYQILDTMIQKMTEADLSDSISHNFIIQMIPHHKAAIEMSYNILTYTTCAPLRKIASNIISEQTQSIKNMQDILCTCSHLTNSERDLFLYQRRIDQIMKTMFTDMGTACANNQISADFMREMIPHHRGAIEMSQNTLQYDICPELCPILDAIITSQKRGIMQMQQLLQHMRR